MFNPIAQIWPYPQATLAARIDAHEKRQLANAAFEAYLDAEGTHDQAIIALAVTRYEQAVNAASEADHCLASQLAPTT